MPQGVRLLTIQLINTNMKLNNEQSAEGCNTYYTTWEEARDAGLLPADYVG